MSGVHFIAMDTHCHSTDICVKTRANRPGRHWRVATTIPAIREVLESVPHPRKLTFEEGPLADWLWRNLREVVDETLVCDPRKNSLVNKDGDKDDPIDAEKVCDLYIQGFLRAVHHPESLRRQVCKQTVGLYHERVVQRVRQSNKVVGLLRRWGVVVREKDFAEAADRAALLERVGELPEHQVVGRHVELLWAGYDEAVREEKLLRRELVRLAKGEEVVARWTALPGIGWIRGLTLLTYLDTPWRFRSKQALWKYLGIGLVREHSGNGREFVHVERGANRVLKGTILGATECALMKGDNPFGEQFRRGVEAGLSRRNARRNAARSLSGVIWGMWKNGSVYDPGQVGRVATGVG